MATFVDLTVPVKDILGVNYIPGKTGVYIAANTPNSLLIVDGTELRIGGRREKPDTDGNVVFTNLVATNSADNPTAFEYLVTFTYTPIGAKSQEHLTTSTFPLTADGNLAAIEEAWDNVTAPPSWRSDFRDEMEALLAQAEAVTGADTADDLIAAVDADAGSDFRVQQDARLSATIGSYRGMDPRAVDPNVDLTGVTDARATIQAALAFGDVTLPRGVFKVVGDLNIIAGGSTLSGMGDETQLIFVGGGLVIDGDSALVAEVQVHGLSVRRNGTAGPAIRLKGAGYSGAPVHIGMHNVRVQSSTGDGLLIDGGYVGTFTNCYFMGAAGYGVKTQADSIEGAVYANNLSFFGGEIASNANAMYLDHAYGISFYGCAIEGNTVSGVEIPSGSYGILFDNCYVEANAGFDLKIGTTGICWGIVVRGGYWTDSGIGKANSIVVERGRGLLFDTLNFIAYGGEPIYINEDFPATVWGEVRNCTTDGSRTGVVSASGADEFNKVYLGKVIADGLAATPRTPSSAFATGELGEVCWDANYVYVCTATNNWKRVALATW